jgi:hypothetical protein
MVKNRKQLILLVSLVAALLLCMLLYVKTNPAFAPDNQQDAPTVPSRQDQSNQGIPVSPSQEDPHNRCLSLDCGTSN